MMIRFSKLVSILILLSSTGCLQVYNSAYRDRNSFTSLDGGANFALAFAVIESRCKNCHQNFLEWTTEQDWIDSGKVVAGDPSSSEIYTALKGSEYSGRRDMPSDSDMPSSERELIKNWIENFGL